MLDIESGLNLRPDSLKAFSLVKIIEIRAAAPSVEAGDYELRVCRP